MKSYQTEPPNNYELNYSFKIAVLENKQRHSNISLFRPAAFRQSLNNQDTA